MIIPLRTDSPLRHTPYTNYALIAANVIVFVVQSLIPGFVQRWELNPGDPRPETFITYAFLHAGMLHIAGNMLFLYIFGNNVNDKLGNIGYLAFYLAGAIFAGIGYAIAPQQVLMGTPVVGASGAIAAVTGAYLILFPHSNVTVLFFFYLIGQYEIASIWFILFFFAYDIWANFAQTDGIAHAAHIGGTLFGCIVCFSLLLVGLLPRDQFDVIWLVQHWNKRRQYRDMVNRGYNPFDYAKGGRSGQEPAIPANPRQGQIIDLRQQISEADAAHDLARVVQLYLQLKQIDPQQVLSRQAQLDVANYLFDQQLYPQAAEAYELFLKHYPKYEAPEQIELVLGLIYARYLGQYPRAKDYLSRAVLRLHDDRTLALARTELAQDRAPIGHERKLKKR